jgi:hypothetical protein
VVLVAVAFDDEAVVWEVGVDLVAVDDGVDQQGREVVLLGEGEEVVLESGVAGVARGLDEFA